MIISLMIASYDNGPDNSDDLQDQIEWRTLMKDSQLQQRSWVLRRQFQPCDNRMYGCKNVNVALNNFS